MGNSLSAEAPWRGQRTSQKLSKPKTSNPTAAGLLNPNGASNPARSSPAARRLSLPTAPSPAPLPDLPETDHVVTASGKRDTESGSRLSRMLFRSNTSKEVPRHHRERSSSVIGIPNSQQGRWSSRANSLRNGSEEVLNYGHTPQGPSSINGSRTSFNYDIGSYEAQRLLNLVEVPSHEGDSVISESRMHISEAMREDLRNRRPSIPDTNTLMTRANSEISLYTPMRRRSLMSTPGVATREVRPDPNSRGRTRYSLPSTPSRRESMESMGVGTISIPPVLISSDPIPRALTPCEAEYKQTGAFKLGTLRITNGSPARSPARDPNDKSTEGSSEVRPMGDYFETPQVAPDSSTEVKSSNTTVENVGNQNTADYLKLSQQLSPDTVDLEPAARYPLSSELVFDDGMLKVPQIQVTSKHTAVEDELFDEEPNEYSSVEVLDVRVDPNAKSLPARPKLTTERRNSKEISRSDSGIASPSSEYSQPPLSKADSGYSSSVSLRSFSLRPPVPDKDRNSDVEVEIIPSASTQQSTESKESGVLSSPIVVASVNVTEPFHGASPPPVPMKDPHLMTPGSPQTPGELSPSLRRNSKRFGAWDDRQMPQRVLSPSNNIRSQANDHIEYHRTSLLNPTTVQSNNYTLSISTGFRKPGKLQRFLSGGRASLTVHNTHPTEQSSVPSVSRDMQVKLQSHSGRLPGSFRRFALKSAASKETLGTILSVGSAELLQDDDVPLNHPSGQPRGLDHKATPISIESAIVDTVSPPFAKKPIPRKPVPVRNKESGARGELTKPQRIMQKISRENIAQSASWHGANGFNKLARENERAK
ncbi:Rho GTPase-activating protein [Hypoxylon texense]